ncbi:SDR family NAD(P)-dependent oxidoreductase [Idiomarina seosinensis]|uniref:SDR family NAD(P)-dependent oxidoreductase n=1 Tax=Idiomarina seosinensis TaxID=281739 RepID=UPI003850001F
MAMVVFGASGGLGEALVKELKQQYSDQTIFAVSRSVVSDRVTGVSYYTIDDYNDEALAQWAEDFSATNEPLTGVLSTVGMLHDDETFPEKQLSDLDEQNLLKLYRVNAVIPMLIVKHCQNLLEKKQAAFFVQLSAKVGSIEDNRLGGWYSYRASKAGLNMLLKTAAIEFKRSHKKLVVAAIHPGTTDTRLSEPFQKRIPKGKLYSKEQSAERIVAVIKQLNAEDSGGLFHWDGERLPF